MRAMRPVTGLVQATGGASTMALVSRLSWRSTPSRIRMALNRLTKAVPNTLFASQPVLLALTRKSSLS